MDDSTVGVYLANVVVNWLARRFQEKVMKVWKVGQKLVSDRKGTEAYIVEVSETNSGIYATLYNPTLGISLYCNTEILAASGWKLSTQTFAQAN
ncbi:hypothetical protein [Floridanema evergladense]|uniref:Uncharacterized protein n=1 Tax=Floridaenema evergladense BLCC-F167 TaxID=3153639 RepID=A0ABV4WLP7_9CYAN